MLKLEYRLDGNIANLIVPPASEPRRANKLWEHTCLEAFIAMPRSSAYVELNFSPSGEWAAHRFDDYRSAMAIEDDLSAAIELHCEPRFLLLTATVDLSNKSAFANGAALRLALSAVIEESGGRMSYWALAHPAAKADFHHPKSFALMLNREYGTV